MAWYIAYGRVKVESDSLRLFTLMPREGSPGAVKPRVTRHRMRKVDGKGDIFVKVQNDNERRKSVANKQELRQGKVYRNTS